MQAAPMESALEQRLGQTQGRPVYASGKQDWKAQTSCWAVLRADWARRGTQPAGKVVPAVKDVAGTWGTEKWTLKSKLRKIQ